MVETHNIQDQYKGDTFDGVQFTLVDRAYNAPIDITDTTIRCQFRNKNKFGKVVKEVTDADGIEVVSAINGVFTIEPFDIDWHKGIYFYDVQFTYLDGTIKTFVQGSLKVDQDTTYGN